MKKSRIAEFAGRTALAWALVSAMAFTGCKDKNTASSKPVLRVGMECAYAPFNWTQTSDKTPDGTPAIPIFSEKYYAYGYDVAVAKMLADHLGMDLEIHKMYRVGRRYGIFSEDSSITTRYLKKLMHYLLKWRRKYFMEGYLKACKSYDKLCQKFNNQESPYFSTIQFRLDKIDIKYKSDYEDTILMDFEFLKIPVGKKYDHGLCVRFGENYMKCVQYPRHSAFFDTDKSYLKY